MRISAFICLAPAIAFFSCKKCEIPATSPQTRAVSTYLQGHWVEHDTTPQSIDVVSLYDISFHTDSFFLQETRWTDVWISRKFTAGTFQLHCDSLSLSGFNVDSLTHSILYPINTMQETACLKLVNAKTFLLIYPQAGWSINRYRKMVR